MTYQVTNAEAAYADGGSPHFEIEHNGEHLSFGIINEKLIVYCQGIDAEPIYVECPEHVINAHVEIAEKCADINAEMYNGCFGDDDDYGDEESDARLEYLDLEADMMLVLNELDEDELKSIWDEAIAKGAKTE